ncbi:MAG: GGDEF domain-containing protein [Pseudomonadota bacterium]
MDRLLRHVDLVTRCRTRGEVEVGVVTAINDLLGARRTELHKIFMPPGDVLVGLSVEIAAGDAHATTHDDGFSWPEHTGSIEGQPRLQACFGSDQPCIERLPDGGTRLIRLLRTEQHEPYAFLMVVFATAPGATEFDRIDGFAALLRNCLALLDYCETDTLTRLLNRKTFDEYLINILASIPNQDDAASGARHLPHRRHPGPEARDHWLGVMDIDHFKSINDRFGHLIGDEVLILLANLMRECFRVQDKLFRFGGEEFIALLRPAEFAHARGTFERFRACVESHVFPQVGHVTVSIGFTRIKLGDTPSAILDSADEALYWAKEHGRNQCHAYETLIAAGKLQRHALPAADVEIF